ncbi:hypothetical protein CDAR_579701 [Caerostris darwini]|uniref:Uncharacterized protein n=1 Tax=Caerostris darwini TaxID=1538125 RepID=A0AAV4RYH2_9ARAC|nr:hypothetical protein CDAR_579701 [Caerostris darwini]
MMLSTENNSLAASYFIQGPIPPYHHDLAPSDCYPYSNGIEECLHAFSCPTKSQLQLQVPERSFADIWHVRQMVRPISQRAIARNDNHSGPFCDCMKFRSTKTTEKRSKQQQLFSESRFHLSVLLNHKFGIK